MQCSNAAQAFSQIVKNLHTLLKPLGFKKKGNHFHRQTEHGVGQLIHTQKSQWNDKSHLGFTFNIGLTCPLLQNDPRFHENGRALPDFPSMYDCLTHERIGRLLPEQERHDLWFEVADDGRGSTVGQEIQTMMQKLVLPHFAVHSKPQQLYPLIGNRYAMRLAVKLGEAEQAKRFYQAEYGWAQRRYREECRMAEHYRPKGSGNRPDPQIWLDYLEELEQDAAKWDVPQI
jgi:hypothetical protein